MMSDIHYFRRKNPDSTIDLICLRCFMTVRITDDDADFPLLELLHRCGAKRVALLPDREDEMNFPERVLKLLSEREELFQKSSR